MPEDIFAQVNKELDDELSRQGLTPQQQQQAPVNDNPSREDLARLQGELSALKDMMEQQNRRFVNQEGDQRPAPAAANAPQKLEPWQYSPDKFVQAAAQDPGQAVLDAINSKLGLAQGTNVFGLFDVVGKRLNDLTEKNKELQDRLQGELLERHAERFIDTHPDYVANEENYKTLQSYLQQYQLPPTVQGYDLAFAKAVSDGRIEKAQVTNPDDQQGFEPYGQQQPPPQQRGPQFIPSVNRRSPGPSETDLNSLFSKLDKLPTADALAYAEKLSRG